MNKLRTLLQSKVFYILSFVILFIYVFYYSFYKEYNSLYDINETKVSGVVSSVKVKKNSIQFEVSGKEKFIANYYIKDDIPSIDNIIGSNIELIGKFKEPINNTIPNTFNYKNYLKHKKINYTFNVDEFSYAKSNNLLYVIKNKMYERIRDDTKANEYLNILILGNKSLIDSDTYNKYLNNGVCHLFAISGMHLAVFILILNKLLRFRYKEVLIMSVLWLYAFIVSFPSSVIRATLFYTLKSIFKLFNIKISNIKILYLTAFIILLVNPLSIFDIGFIYSFITVLSILINSNKIRGNYFRKMITTSIITLIYTIPITASLNYEINFLSIINNLIFIPLITLVIYPLSLITYIIPIFEGLYNVLIVVMESINSFMNDIALFKIIIPKLNMYIILIYYLILYFIKYSKRVVILIVFLIMFKYIDKMDSSYYVYYLDIGQGDSSLLISPYRKEVIMIDTGGVLDYSSISYYKSDNTIKFLKSLGISKIDLLIISHGDSDHCGDALNIIRKYQVDNVILNNNELNSIEENLKNNSNVVSSYDSRYFDINNYNDYVSDDENYSSIITFVNILDNKFLFMGDLPIQNELKYMKMYDLDSDYLKLGHHGSKTSSDRTFLEEVSPKLGIISSGRNNLYRHPSKEVVDTLDKLSIDYYNTAESGTIEIKINSLSSTISNYPP